MLEVQENASHAESKRIWQFKNAFVWRWIHTHIYIYITSKCAWLHSLTKNKICWTKPSGPFFAKVTCIQMPGNAKDRWTLTLNQFQANSFLVLSFRRTAPQSLLISEFFFSSWAPNWLQGNSRNLTLDQLNGVSLEMIHIKHQPGMSWHDQPDLMISIPVDTSACGQLSESSMCDVWTGWWYTYPSEKYEIQLGLWHSQYMEQYKMFQTTNQVTMCHYVRLCVTLLWLLVQLAIVHGFQPILGDVWSTALLLTTHENRSGYIPYTAGL